ncbi:MAG TPA: signal peptide peptidase SppA [Thermoanaerobaculia bacterium]|nr:signal peptide peptidase SppA [Thermoanaerobaculia bacterium]
MRRLLALLLVLALIGIAVALTGLWLAGRHGDRPILAGPRVLELVLDSRLEDHRAESPFLLPGEVAPPTVSAIWRGLDAARRDPAVRGVVLRIVDADFGLAKAAELRRQIELTAASGRFVACYLETAGEGTNGTLEYYVASACPALSLAPAGEINLLGLWSDAYFLRGSLDKLGVEPSFLTAGRFKSAGETFTERAHSPAAREALDRVLDAYFEQIVDGIASSRGLDPGDVRELVDEAPLSAELALERGLVDALEFPDEFDGRLETLAGGEPELVPLVAYAHRHERWRAGKGSVAVVFARGVIVRGGGGTEPWSGETFLGAERLGRLLADLAEDDAVAAVVLRVDSPGGSALASDLILRRVELLDAAKPVIVSMSDVAASGGYYIAARARRIVAEPGTLTGSIGVITGKLASGRFQEEKLGITHDVLARGRHAGLYSSLRPFDEQERALIARRVDEIYLRFLGHVAAGRRLELDAVREVAEGRVWTGQDALAVGLVDELGGLDAALDAARDAAGLDADAAVVFYPRPRGLWDWLAGLRDAPLSAELARVLRALAATREPFALELPRSLAGLAQPF